MSSVAIADGQILVDGQPVFIRGAEIHYYRLPRDTWRDRLRAARGGACNLASSYMPWYWHEPAEGAIDLDGHARPECDLRAFLDLAAEAGLYVIARPGPFVNSELRCGGIPEWVFRQYPETMSRRADGQYVTGRTAPAEGEPHYRLLVRRWFKAVNTLLAEYQADRGGPVILYQPDNELSAAWTFGLLNSLYDPAILAETWPAWLRRHYPDLDAANRRFGTRAASHAELAPPRRFPTGPGERLLAIAWLDFKRWFFADWGATMAQWACEDGIVVPFVFNEPVAGFYGHGDHAGFGQEMLARGLAGTTACHTYSDRLIDLEGVQGAAWGVELTKSSPWGGVPLSVEANTQWFIPRLSRSTINWAPLFRAAAGHGLTGAIVYPWAAATSPLEDTIEGPEYFEPSCVDRAGQPAASYQPVTRFYSFAQAWEADLLAARLVPDLTLAYSPGQRYHDFLGAAGPGGVPFDAEPSLATPGAAGHEWLDGVEGVTQQATGPESGVWHRTREAGILFTRLNLAWDARCLNTPNRPPGEGVLVVPSTGWAEAAFIDYVLAHLEAGGGALFFPAIPAHHLDQTPDDRLLRVLDVAPVRNIRPAGGQPLDYGTRPVQLADGSTVGLPGWLRHHRFGSGWEVLVTHQGAPLAARRGNVVIAGCDAQYTSYGSLRLWQSLLGHLKPAATCQGTWRHVLLRQGPAASFAAVLDLAGVPGTSRLSFPALAIDLEVDLHPHEARLLVLNTTLGGARLAYATSELVPTALDRRSFTLHGAPGTAGTLAFRRPVRLSIDGQPRASQPEGSLHLVRYRHGLDPLAVTLA